MEKDWGRKGRKKIMTIVHAIGYLRELVGGKGELRKGLLIYK